MKKILYYIKNNKDYLIFSFFIISIICWVGEIIYGIIIKNRTTLPGALYGPWCPVYGFAFILLLINTKNKYKIVNFIKVFILVAIIEFIASYISQFLFKSIPWDYTNYPLNIDGRICLQMSLLFSLLAYFLTNILDNIIRKIFYKIKKYIKIINIVFIITFIIDILIHIIK